MSEQPRIEPTAEDRAWAAEMLAKGNRDALAEGVAIVLATAVISASRGLPLSGHYVALAEAWDASLDAEMTRLGVPATPPEAPVPPGSS